jgi:hypothetical protein
VLLKFPGHTDSLVLLKFPGLFAIPSHAASLMLSALFAHTTRDVGGVGGVQVVPAVCHQGGLELVGPLLIGLREPPHLA